MSRAEAVARVEWIVAGDYPPEDELHGWLEGLDRALACPSGYVSDLIHWPPAGELTAAEVVDRALAYRPIAL
ncbi:e9imm peptide [Streptomyces sp. NPDC087897]|uniref:e9imm peptide n=1 Tax=Streptomyces sp. NPDC087897 TaxID=3365817 RepID=UPI003809CA5A